VALGVCTAARDWRFVFESTVIRTMVSCEVIAGATWISDKTSRVTIKAMWRHAALAMIIEL